MPLSRGPSAGDDGAARPKPTAFETALIVGGVVLLMALLYSMGMFQMRNDRNPLLIGVAGVILLWPLRSNRVVRAILLSGAFLMAFWFLDVLSSVLLPFVVVYLLAYMIDPAVTLAHERLRVLRWVSSAAAAAAVVGLVVLFLFLIVPSLVNQFEDLARRLLDSVVLVQRWLTNSRLLDHLQETGLLDKSAFISQLSQFIQEQATILARGIPDAGRQLANSIGALVSLVTTLTIMPVVLFYTLKDYPTIKARLIELFPTFGGRRDYLMKAGGIVGNYLRGQLTISAIAAFDVSVLLLIFNVPFGLLIGIVGGVLNMVPNLGIIMTNLFGVLIALVFGDPWYVDMAIILGVLMAQSLLESAVLSPNILSHQVGLHPVLILLSLFVFGYFFGAFGLVIAVPSTALMVTFFKSYRKEMSVELATAEVTEPSS